MNKWAMVRHYRILAHMRLKLKSRIWCMLARDSMIENPHVGINGPSVPKNTRLPDMGGLYDNDMG